MANICRASNSFSGSLRGCIYLARNPEVRGGGAEPESARWGQWRRSGRPASLSVSGPPQVAEPLRGGSGAAGACAALRRLGSLWQRRRLGSGVRAPARARPSLQPGTRQLIGHELGLPLWPAALPSAAVAALPHRDCCPAPGTCPWTPTATCRSWAGAATGR